MTKEKVPYTYLRSFDYTDDGMLEVDEIEKGDYVRTSDYLLCRSQLEAQIEEMRQRLLRQVESSLRYMEAERVPDEPRAPLVCPTGHADLKNRQWPFTEALVQCNDCDQFVDLAGPLPLKLKALCKHGAGPLCPYCTAEKPAACRSCQETDIRNCPWPFDDNGVVNCLREERRVEKSSGEHLGKAVRSSLDDLRAKGGFMAEVQRQQREPRACTDCGGGIDAHGKIQHKAGCSVEWLPEKSSDALAKLAGLDPCTMTPDGNLQRAPKSAADHAANCPCAACKADPVKQELLRRQLNRGESQ